MHGVIRLAIQAGLGEPARRDLLFAWLPNTYRGAIPVMSRPTDQLMIDVQHLLKLPHNGAPALVVWLENAERLTDYMPGVPAQFAAVRRVLQSGGTIR
jgi:hypothetical protein